ncbi:Hypothetical protein I595_3344 [Croceitalea dokdonensis DOKDO 023]|uniref:Alginate lyase domain-containing protein n=1 Tax=Croceitalea dokdonensis DOKDO 023 TaxID=1300341 RepID=A0A0P7ABJ0_9FLAO|nr:alginate lyase family protein [Croceitalea dokdonensis]KPM30523.1 Hypothetical protein I595_3344 [Croceitalea dokdonensis DOKDO 023]
MPRKTTLYFLVLPLYLVFLVQGNAQLTNLDFEKLAKVKTALEHGDVHYLPAYKRLIREADKALDEGPFSVLQKKMVAASGDKQDYLSLAPYWWPDPEKENGLPWIRKDGIVNPMTKGDNVDDPIKDKMINNVKVLSLAYFFSGKKMYAKKVQKLLQVWFVDLDTRMNPNLNYAQGIPGKNDGRGFGIIEFSGISHVITALEILGMQNQLDLMVEKGVRKWLKDYLVWLQTSEFGVFEKTRNNNHGSLYDVQVVSLLLYLGKEKEAQLVLNTVFEQRIKHQIEPDGSQPHELKRTKGLTYSILNLSALTKLAFYGRKLGVELWEQSSEEGDLQKAYDFLYPYLDETISWPYEQLGDMGSARERLRRMYVTSGSLLNVPLYCKLASGLERTDDVRQLLYPCFL